MIGPNRLVPKLSLTLCSAVIFASAASAANGEDVRGGTAPLTVFCAGAAATAVTQIAGDFERSRNVHVVVVTGTVGQLRDRLTAGEHADIVIVSSTALDALARSGAIVAGTRIDVGTTGIGVGVKTGADLPDISTSDALRDVLLHARTIATTDPASGASSGIFFAALLERMHIAQIVGPKEKLVAGGFSCELVARGEADLCVQNVTEILPVRGVRLVGLFPTAIANPLTYDGAVLQQSANGAIARDFLRDIAAPAHRTLLHDAGFTLSPASP